MEDWYNFCVVIGAQALVFLLLAYQKSSLRTITVKLILQCMGVGVVCGVAFDLVLGKYLGIYNYTIGFGASFLVVNGALSYGLMTATVTLLRSERFLRFYAWTTVVGALYELVNYFFPVWSWQFKGPFVYQEGVVVFAAYCGGALLLAIVMSLTLRMHFRFLESKG